MQKYFVWDQRKFRDGDVQRAWRKKAGVRYRDFLEGCRKKKQKPKLLSDDQWRQWLAFYETPRYLEMVARNRQNKRGGDDDFTQRAPTTHIGGSINFPRAQK